MRTAVPVLLLAGSRPRPDPICTAYRTRYKALAPIGGAPMILQALRALEQSERVSRVIVLAQEPERIREALKDYSPGGKVSFSRSRGGIAATVIDAWQNHGLKPPFLVTTADNCLLTGAHLDDFLDQAQESESDVCIGFMDRNRLISKYPENRRTWIPFSDVAVTGCNLFLLRNENARIAVDFWREFECTPKKVLRIAWSMGPGLFWRFWRRRLGIADAFARISKLTGARVNPVLLHDPDIAIDVDKFTDIQQVEKILYRRGAAGAIANAGRWRPLVIFDLDRTITRRGTYTPFLCQYAFRKNPAALLYLPLVAVLMAAYALGLLDRGSLKARMFGLLVGSIPEHELECFCAGYVERALRDGVHDRALETIKGWRQKGARLVLATASYDWLAAAFAERLGFDEVVATRSLREQGRVVAGVDGANCRGSFKLGMVSAAVGPLSPLPASGAEVWCYTDHHSDIPLLEQCSHPVAVNATRRLHAWAARTPGAQVLDWRDETRPTAVRKCGMARGHIEYGSLWAILLITLNLGLITAFTSDSLWADDVALDQVPAQVMAAVNGRLPGILIAEAEVALENDIMIYEIEGDVGGKEYEVEVTSDGNILKVEED